MMPANLEQLALQIGSDGTATRIDHGLLVVDVTAAVVPEVAQTPNAITHLGSHIWS